MKVLVDTSVWSLALRRPGVQKQPIISELEYLIKEVRVQLIGPIRQELLSGIKSKKQFDQLKNYLKAFFKKAIVLGHAAFVAFIFAPFIPSCCLKNACPAPL